MGSPTRANIAHEEKEKADLVQASLSVDRGIALAKQGRTQRGLLWMAQVWLYSRPEPRTWRERSAANLAAWCSQVAPLIASLDHPKNNAVKMGKMVLRRTLATISGSQDKRDSRSPTFGT